MTPSHLKEKRTKVSFTENKFGIKLLLLIFPASSATVPELPNTEFVLILLVTILFSLGVGFLFGTFVARLCGIKTSLESEESLVKPLTNSDPFMGDQPMSKPPKPKEKKEKFSYSGTLKRVRRMYL